MCDSHAQVVIPSVNRQCLFIPTTSIPSPGLNTVAVVSTAVSHMCDNGIVIKSASRHCQPKFNSGQALVGPCLATPLNTSVNHVNCDDITLCFAERRLAPLMLASP